MGNTECDRPPHGGLFKGGILRNLSLGDEPMPYQLVGEVTAHQGLRVPGLRG